MINWFTGLLVVLGIIAFVVVIVGGYIYLMMMFLPKWAGYLLTAGIILSGFFASELATIGENIRNR